MEKRNDKNRSLWATGACHFLSNDMGCKCGTFFFYGAQLGTLSVRILILSFLLSHSHCLISFLFSNLLDDQIVYICFRWTHVEDVSKGIIAAICAGEKQQNSAYILCSDDNDLTYYDVVWYSPS